MRTPRAFSVWWMGLIAGCAAVLAAPRVLPREAQRVALPDGRTVRLLCLYFLDAAGRAELEAHGWPDYAEKLGDRSSSV